MRTPVRSATIHRSWLFSIVALLLMAAQLTLAIAPLTEGRDDRMASHVEAGGAQTHYAHNDATCASCQARSIHGTSPRPSPAFFDVGAHAFIAVETVDRIVSVADHSLSSPRAPPAVI
jgi:hypothetical protein